jgi:hypothetical protein
MHYCKGEERAAVRQLPFIQQYNSRMTCHADTQSVFLFMQSHLHGTQLQDWLLLPTVPTCTKSWLACIAAAWSH